MGSPCGYTRGGRPTDFLRFLETERLGGGEVLSAASTRIDVEDGKFVAELMEAIYRPL